MNKDNLDASKHYIEQMLLNIADELNVKEVVIEDKHTGIYGTYKYDTITGNSLGFDGDEWLMGAKLFNGNIIDDMSKVREIVSDGLKQRSDNNVKVRQPLQSVTVYC